MYLSKGPCSPLISKKFLENGQKHILQVTCKKNHTKNPLFIDLLEGRKLEQRKLESGKKSSKLETVSWTFRCSVK